MDKKVLWYINHKAQIDNIKSIIGFVIIVIALIIAVRFGLSNQMITLHGIKEF